MVIDNPYSNNKQVVNFYDCPEDLSLPTYAKYQVLDTEVLVGNRPNLNKQSSGKLFPMNKELYDSIDSFINVSDNFVKHRADKVNYFFPFNEAGNPTVETIFGALETLDYQIRVLKLKRIYIHCDLGSHRAPSIFGMYLFAFHPKNIKKINKNYKLVNLEPIEWSSPRQYMRSYIKEDEVIYTFLRHFKSNRKKTTSLEVIIDCKNNQKVKQLLFNERNWEPVSQISQNPFFGTIRYGKLMIQHLIREFKPSLESIYQKIKSPLIKLKIDIHIALGTKRGKGWEKHGFGTKNEKKHQNKKTENP